MDKIKIGIPRSIPYYYFDKKWTYYFEKLDIEVITSPKTNKRIINDGLNYANDEMCLSLKIYMGHVNFLKDKCDYILIPRIENYGVDNQTCTNFLSLYDLVKNAFEVNVLNYNVALSNHETEEKGFVKIGKRLGKKGSECKKSYIYAKAMSYKDKKKQHLNNLKKLSSSKLKILMVGHPYNIEDEYVGIPVLKALEKLNIEWINAYDFDPKITNKLSSKLSKDIYWKYSKELIGAIKFVEDKINGIIFVSSFPCGPDSLVNDLVIRKLKLPYLNLVIDDLDSLSGVETRLESFVDIIENSKTNS
ncbi:MAG: acyl-CoA dehydratase activase-related protein [Bacilli bacterium]